MDQGSVGCSVVLPTVHADCGEVHWFCIVFLNVTENSLRGQGFCLIRVGGSRSDTARVSTFSLGTPMGLINLGLNLSQDSAKLESLKQVRLGMVLSICRKYHGQDYYSEFEK